MERVSKNLECMVSIQKICVRIPYDNKRDLVVAIRPVIKNGEHINNKVVTAWLNYKNDTHTTLNTSNYCSQQEWNECC